MTTLPTPCRPLVPPGPRPPRVGIVTGSYGAGHDSAAREIARTLGEAGCAVETYDVVELLPWRLGRMLRAAYYRQLRTRPGSWDTTLRLLEPGRYLHTMATSLLGVAVEPVVEATRGCDLVVSTHPFASQALGMARKSGRIGVPAVTYLTDTSVHSLWVHTDVDLHLAVHEIAADEARALGGRALAVRPLVPPGTVDAVHISRTDPLAAYEIVGRRALVTGGSLGMGELEATARDILATGLMTPVVVCGTDAGLRERLEDRAGVVALGWRDDLLDLIATSDCVVQNAGGFTSLEALAAGTPVVSYRPLPGHGVANCANLARAGLVPSARDVAELGQLLRWAIDAPRGARLPVSAPSVRDVLLESRVSVSAA